MVTLDLVQVGDDVLIHAVIDDELFDAAAKACPDLPSPTALIEEALRAFVERNSARDLARMVRGHRFELAPVSRRRAPRPDR